MFSLGAAWGVKVEINPSCPQNSTVAFLPRQKVHLHAEENHVRVPSGDLCQNGSFGAAAQAVTCGTEREAGMSASGRSSAGTKPSPRGLLPYPAPRAATELVFLLSAHAEKVELHPEASVVI